MKTIIVLSILMIWSYGLNAQTYCSWHFQYDFKLEINDSIGYKYDSIQVLVSDPIQTHGPYQSTYLTETSLQFNDSTNTYSVSLTYGWFKCIFNSPVIYVQVYLFSPSLNQNFSILIPITFDDPIDLTYYQQNTDKAFGCHINLGTVVCSDFIKSDSLLEKYEGLRIKSEGKIDKYKRGEYLFPCIDKLIKI